MYHHYHFANKDFLTFSCYSRFINVAIIFLFYTSLTIITEFRLEKLF